MCGAENRTLPECCSQHVVWDMDEAFKQLDDLIELSARHSFDLAELFYRLSNADTAILQCQVDSAATMNTGNFVVRYKLADEVLACLSALRNCVNKFNLHKSEGLERNHD
jgi:hypothetical protein